MGISSILVLGATGKTGRHVVSQLQQRDVSVRAASRSASTRFDWSDEATWAPALDGVDAVYLVKSEEADAAETLGAFCEQAVAGGARRLVFLSYRDAANEDTEHPDSERAVMDVDGAEWTILRPTWFSQNFSELAFLRASLLRGELLLPAGDGVEGFIDAEDIAATAVGALTEDGHAGKSYDISGPRLLTFGDAVGAIAEATGRDIRYRAVSDDEFTAHAIEQGESPGFARSVNWLCRWIRNGSNAHLSDGVQTVTGREPRDLVDYVKATAPSGVWTPDG